MICDGPRNAKIIAIGQTPGRDEIRSGRPFSGSSGWEWDKMLREAGLSRSNIFCFNVTDTLPPSGKVENFFSKKREADKNGLPFIMGRRPNDDCIVEGIKNAYKVIDSIQPNVIIALGDLAMWALTGERGIMKWRGSIMESNEINGKVYKVIPTYNPAFVQRNWPTRWIAIQDHRRAFHQSLFPEIKHPKRSYLIRPTFDEAMDAIERARGTETTNDLETWSNQIACVGIGYNMNEAACIPFMCSDKPEGYWTADEELLLTLKLKDVLTDPNTSSVFHNGHFDLQYYIAQWGYMPNVSADTMVLQHVCYPDMRKALDFCASLYCKHYKFWKDEGRNWSPDLQDDEEYWKYNCLMKGTGVITEFGTKLIESIVRDELDCKVLTMNENTNKAEWKNIIGWHKTVKRGQKWLRIKLVGAEIVRGIICTPDHEILTTNGRKEAKDITTNDFVFMPELSYSEEYLGALVGTLLGDSSFNPTSNSEKSVVTCTQVSLPLIEEKLRLMSGVVKSYLFKGTSYNNYKPRRMHVWSLSASRQIELLRKLMCRTGKKEATEALEYLTPLGVALWYMDDGFQQKAQGNRQPTCCFAIQGFDDKASVVNWITKTYGKCRVDGNGTLRLTVGASKKLCEVINRYVIPSMRYKLPYKYEDYMETEIEEEGTFVYAKVESTGKFDPSTMSNRGYTNVRYCLSVEDNSNFMTVGGLVSNCQDVLNTFEVYEVQKNIIKKRNLQNAADIQMRMFYPILKMMLRGVNVDRKFKEWMKGDLQLAMRERAEWFEEVLGYPFNPMSNGKTGQMQRLFYDDFNVKKVMKKAPPYNPTLDDAAIETLKKRNPVLRPLLEACQEYRSLSTFKSNFAEMRLSPDERIRCSINMSFVKTYRLSTSENIWKEGRNLQNMSKGKEKD